MRPARESAAQRAAQGRGFGVIKQPRKTRSVFLVGHLHLVTPPSGYPSVSRSKLKFKLKPQIQVKIKTPPTRFAGGSRLRHTIAPMVQPPKPKPKVKTVNHSSH